MLARERHDRMWTRGRAIGAGLAGSTAKTYGRTKAVSSDGVDQVIPCVRLNFPSGPMKKLIANMDVRFTAMGPRYRRKLAFLGDQNLPFRYLNNRWLLRLASQPNVAA